MKEPITTTTIKNIGYGIAFLVGSVGLPPESFYIFAALMVADTVTGVAKVGILHGPRAIRSAKLTAGVLAKAFVFTAPIVVAWTGKGAGFDLTTLAEGILSLLILAEGYSVLGNIYSIQTRKETQEWDAVAAIIGTARKVIEQIISNANQNKDEK